GDALDAACGTGRYAEYLAGRGHRVLGVDSSPEMLARARARVPSGEFVLGDLHELPLPDSSVDLVVSTLALAHVPTLAPVMAVFVAGPRPRGIPGRVGRTSRHRLALRPSRLGQRPRPRNSKTPTGVSAGRRLVSPAKDWWPGAGSNRRPSAFQVWSGTSIGMP